MSMADEPNGEPRRCFWCNADRYESALRHEGPHATWCVHFREEQRGGGDEDRAIAARLRPTPRAGGRDDG